MSTACFADFAVVAEEGAVIVGREGPDRDEANVPFDALATVGCAVVTGIGAVLNAARVPRGATVAVIGTGGVGLNVVQGAVIAGAERIIACDRRPAPLELARPFGATDLVDATSGNIADRIRDLTGGVCADFVFDTVCTQTTLSDAIDAARKGGTIVLTGLSRRDGRGHVPVFPFVVQEKKLIGSVYGSGRPVDDIARMVGWYREGRVKLRELVSRTYALHQVNDALAALADARGARGVILR